MGIIYWYWYGDDVVGWTALGFTAFSLGRLALPCPATLLLRWVVAANDKSFNPTSTSTTSTPRLSLRHPSNIHRDQDGRRVPKALVYADAEGIFN